MSEAVKILKAMMRETSLSMSNIVHAVTLARVIIEEHELKSYARLRFYSDWTVHASLDRNNTVPNILVDINNAISEYRDKATDDLLTAVSKATVGNLRLEIQTLFNAYGISRKWIDDSDGWKMFVGNILANLKERPLRFLDDKKRDDAYLVQDTSFTKTTSIKLATFPEFQNSICFEIFEAKKGVRIRGPLVHPDP